MFIRIIRFFRAMSMPGYAVLILALLFVAGGIRELTATAKPDTRPYHEQMQESPKLWLESSQPLEHYLAAQRSNKLANVGVADSTLLYTLKDGKRYATSVPQAFSLTELRDLGAKGVGVTHLKERNPLWTLLGSASVIVTIMLVLVVMTGGFAGAQDRLPRMSRDDGDSEAGDAVETPTIRFSDVVGADQAKKTLIQVKSFLTDPGAYAELGAKPYRGVLLEGPPGTGKTLLARALAGECGASFIAVDGSHFSSNLMGNGIRKVEALFKRAREQAPCILFIDEFDGIGKRKSDTSSAAADEDNRIINKLLVELDGFSPTEGVIVLAATNHRENLDEAMLRDGRFDATVQVGLPTLAERRGLFDMYLGKVKSGGDVDAVSLARMSSGMSPAAIAGVVNRAAVLAADARSKAVSQEHVLRALETKQLGGEPNGSRMLTEKTRQRIAVHEAGHALVAHVLATGVVERVSIEPRGQALGVTYVTQEDEDNLFEPQHLARRLAMMLAGREAELLVLGNTSSGASDDLRRATELATTMVGRLGFSESFGLLSLEGLPPELVSPEVRNALLQECSKILGQARDHARTSLETHRDALDALTTSLLAEETIGPDVLKDLLPAVTKH